MVNLDSQRDNNFNLLRAVFATLVILSHAFEMAYNGRWHEPFGRFTGTSTSLGEVAVAGFFLISGYLIMGSWMRGPDVSVYLRKRLLRIAPGYMVAALLSTLVVGMATGGLQFFHHLQYRYAASLLMFDTPITPSVFPGTMWDFVNGSLWTIKYEFRCYLLIPLLGLVGFYRNRFAVFALTGAVSMLAFAPAVQKHFLWHHWLLPLGNPVQLYPLAAAFLCGACFYLVWDRLPHSWWFQVVVAAALAPLLFHELLVQPALIVLGGYLLFSFAFAPIPFVGIYKRVPDLSYGIYLYGWPVEALWTRFLHTPPIITFVGSFLMCLPLASLSWHLVELPALRLKPKGSVPLTENHDGVPTTASAYTEV